MSPPFIDAVLPSYDGAGIANLPLSVLQAFGGRLDGHHPLSPQALDPSFFDGVRTVVLILVDGLGYPLFQRAVAAHPDMALARLAREQHLARLTSVLPSTTTTALATLSTGLTPQEHGLVGYKLYLREVDEIANMIRFSPVNRLAPYPRKRLNPQAFFDHETIYQKLEERGVTSRVIIKHLYAHSPLSRMFYRGAEIVSHAGTHDAFVMLRRALEQRGTTPSFIFFYWDPIDSVSHNSGPASDEVAAEIAGLDFALRTLVLDHISKANDVALLITADHGHIHTVPERRLTFNSLPPLMDMLVRPPSGDSRLPYVQAKEGALERACGALRAHFGEVVDPVPVQDALARGWFGHGPCHPESLSRIGNLVLAVANGYKLSYRYSEEEFESIGVHGGTDPEEMWVPLIAARL